jgi:hypothetical protein
MRKVQWKRDFLGMNLLASLLSPTLRARNPSRGPVSPSEGLPWLR